MPSGGGRCKQEPLVPRKVHSAETKGRQEERLSPGRGPATTFFLDESIPGARDITHHARDSFELPAKKVTCLPP
ncbi:hypothetical protein ALC62_00872 [Cyphomyrmex costatus]|uniref:Uncharacterized protein n=1 Tax=Cyphomyrmex costatus TaxID=456900 RepID=A0A195D577_9HYME|nr:hypothetical protein ALC62_00872 [Cyphomyrmex costatus]